MSDPIRGAARATPHLTGDEYMDLLVERQAAYVAAHPPLQPWAAPLLEWFVLPGDEEIFTPPKATPRQRPARRPRTYRPASHWREKLERLDAALASLDPGPRHGTTDRAAYGGVGIPQTARQNAKWDTRISRTARRYVELTQAREEVAGKLARAEMRERGRPHD